MFVLLAIDPSTRETGWAVFSSEAFHQGQRVTAKQGELSSPLSRVSQEESLQADPQWKLKGTGVIVVHDRSRHVEVAARIKAIEEELDSMAETWNPHEVACGKPSLMHLAHQQAGVKMLVHALERWAEVRNLPLHSYTSREIRTAILGRCNAAREELVFAVMTRWDLLGKGKTTHEWNAIAVGDYHLGRHKMAGGIEI